MKKKLLIRICCIAALVAGVTASCDESNLEKQPQTPTEADYFLTESEFERAVFAVYAKSNAHYAWNGGIYNNAPGTAFWQLPGDDMTTSGGSESAAFEAFNDLTPGNGILSRFFKTSYEVIGRANVVLEKLDQENGVYQTANLKAYHRGEVLFLRGYQNFLLWNYFGTAPLITERPEGKDDVFPSPSSGTQLLDQAIADFTAAATLLPDNWDAANRGRVTKNSAHGFLGKALVFRGTVTNSAADFQAAITSFDAIMGVSLVNDYSDNFAFDQENNSESLYEYQASQSAEENIWLPDEFDNNAGSMSTSSWLPFEGINSWGYGGAPFRATQKLADAFEVGDPRIGKTFDPTSKAILKYVQRDRKVPNGASSVNNPRILRYADVLLLKAEAILKSGGSKSEAIGLINQIRGRARAMVVDGTIPADLNTAITDNATIMQWIMDERFRELAFEEGIRWMDLRRWHLAGDITLDDAFFNSTNGNFNIQLPKHLYFPIPSGELDLNPNMKQNPEY